MTMVDRHVEFAEISASMLERIFGNFGWTWEKWNDYGESQYFFSQHGRNIELRTYASRMDETQGQYVGYFIVELNGNEAHIIDEEGKCQLNSEEDRKFERQLMIAAGLVT